EAKVLHPQPELLSIFYQIWTPVVEKLNSSDLDVFIVNIQPIVFDNFIAILKFRQDIFRIESNPNSNKVSVLELRGNVHQSGVRFYGKRLEKLVHWHCREKIL